MCLLDEWGDIVHTGIIKPKKMVGVERLDFISNEVISFILKNCVGYDEIRLSREEYSFSSKGSSIFNLGELGGVIDLSIYRMSSSQLPDKVVQYYRIPAGVHKKYIVKNGNAKKGTTKATKKKYLDLIEKHSGEKFDDDNIADAFMIARTLRASYEIIDDPDMLSDMDSEDRENRLLFIPPKLRKKKKLTPSSIYDMNHLDYSEMVLELFMKTYMIFEKMVYND
jgi:Holliday junction resolvasome RuvABC endonuclease subunit